MPPRLDRTTLLDRLADHVLDHGLAGASLRPMAAAAGTSDRMLIYHFGSKDALVAALLTHLAQGLAARLEAGLPPVPLATEADLIARVIALMRGADLARYIRVWFDVLAASAQGRQPQRDMAHAMIGMFRDWVAARHPQGAARADYVLTLIEGALVMDAVGQTAISSAALLTGPAARQT